MSFHQTAKPDFTERNALKRRHFVADSSKHLAHLPVLALVYLYFNKRRTLALLYHFYLCRRSDKTAYINAAAEARGALIRRCGNYPGLDDTWYRTAVRTRRENDALLAALREVLA